MPTNIRIIHAHDFIKVTPEGQLDLAESRKLLIEIAAASAPLARYDVVLDTRKVQSEMSATDLWDLAAELSQSLTKVFAHLLKTVVICPVERFDHAKFFALCAQNRGFRVQAFTSLHDAWEWLVADQP